jgi:hypothetical protein
MRTYDDRWAKERCLYMTREGPEGKDVVIKSNKRQTVGS